MENVCLPSGKKLKDLKVVALQKELGKRRLSKVGKKIELIERLAQSLTADNVINEENTPPPQPEIETNHKTSKTRTVTSEVSSPITLDSSLTILDSPPTISNSSPEIVETSVITSKASALATKASASKRGSSAVNCKAPALSPKVSASTPKTSAPTPKASAPTPKASAPTPKASAPTPKASAPTPKASSSRKSKTPTSGRKKSIEVVDLYEFLSDDDEFVPEKPASIEVVSENPTAMEVVSENSEAMDVVPEPIAEPLEMRGLLKKKMRKQSNTPLLGSIASLTPKSGKKEPTNKLSNINNTPDRRKSRKSVKSSLLGLSSASKQIQKKESVGSSRFTQQHAKEFAKMETISDHQDKIKARHDTFTGKLPDFVKRLATPKSAKIARSRVPNVGKGSKTVEKHPTNTLNKIDPLKKIDLNTFKFGNVAPNEIKATQKNIVVKPVDRERKVRKSLEKSTNKADVKQLTKALQLTIPIQNRRLDYLSTPKALKSDSKQSRCGYTPRKGTVKFVDTSKLSDEEFAIAVKSGLVPKSSRVVAEYNRAIKTDQLLDIKRKLKLN